jgi:hypothetical protein
MAYQGLAVMVSRSGPASERLALLARNSVEVSLNLASAVREWNLDSVGHRATAEGLEFAVVADAAVGAAAVVVEVDTDRKWL